MRRRRKRIDPAKGIADQATPAELIRFLRKIRPVPCPEPEAGGMCWEWQGYRDEHGYGQFWWRGRAVWAHRFSRSQLHRRPMSDGLEVDHVCRNHSCCNPDHLGDLTVAENRGRRVPAAPPSAAPF